jgi:hypothetical protein
MDESAVASKGIMPIQNCIKMTAAVIEYTDGHDQSCKNLLNAQRVKTRVMNERIFKVKLQPSGEVMLLQLNSFCSKNNF